MGQVPPGTRPNRSFSLWNACIYQWQSWIQQYAYPHTICYGYIREALVAYGTHHTLPVTGVMKTFVSGFPSLSGYSREYPLPACLSPHNVMRALHMAPYAFLPTLIRRLRLAQHRNTREVPPDVGAPRLSGVKEKTYVRFHVHPDSAGDKAWFAVKERQSPVKRNTTQDQRVGRPVRHRNLHGALRNTV